MAKSTRQKPNYMHHLYAQHPDNNKNVCMYCTMPADTIDHVPARSVVQMLGDDHFDELFYVDCCRECNTALGDAWLNTIAERATYLVGYYRKRYKSLLNMPKWTQEDIDDLSEGSLKKNIIASSKQKEVLEHRLSRLLDLSE